ncbi:unnamed protein product [Prunus armeniaca]|uniref:Uncharacterized protein n=1 Tax=Prunus armeniaca TaxID=36596 RepID=A0A6J5W4T5_PRUAR|nr:unnamed protein product [Prunus armeniaca]
MDRKALDFDLKALLSYASANVTGFPPSPSNFTVSKFGHGQSNPTYNWRWFGGFAETLRFEKEACGGKLLPLDGRAAEQQISPQASFSKRSVSAKPPTHLQLIRRIRLPMPKLIIPHTTQISKSQNAHIHTYIYLYRQRKREPSRL